MIFYIFSCKRHPKDQTRQYDLAMRRTRLRFTKLQEKDQFTKKEKLITPERGIVMNNLLLILVVFYLINRSIAIQIRLYYMLKQKLLPLIN